eukprot:1545922-Amphidinium_carterae.1
MSATHSTAISYVGKSKQVAESISDFNLCNPGPRIRRSAVPRMPPSGTSLGRMSLNGTEL